MRTVNIDGHVPNNIQLDQRMRQGSGNKKTPTIK
jgi:hypothetical protein